MLNRVLTPAPELLLFLFVAIGLAPRVISEAFRRHVSSCLPLLGFGITALLLVPSALGLADQLHLFFSGAPLLLLALSGLRSMPYRYWALSALAGAILAGEQLPTVLLKLHFTPAQQQEHQRLIAEAQRLGSIVPQGSLDAPGSLPFPLQYHLLRQGTLRPDFFHGLDNAWDAAGESRKIREIADSPWLLMPPGPLQLPAPDDRRRMLLLRGGYRYSLRHTGYTPPLEFLRTVLLRHATLSPLSAELGDGLLLYRQTLQATDCGPAPL